MHDPGHPHPRLPRRLAPLEEGVQALGGYPEVQVPARQEDEQHGRQDGHHRLLVVVVQAGVPVGERVEKVSPD